MSRLLPLLIGFLLLTLCGFGQTSLGQTSPRPVVPDSSVYKVVYRARANGGITGGFWRFKAGDSLDWATPAYNDSRWEHLPPDAPLIQNKALWQQQKGWFRLYFRLRPRQLNDEISLVIRQFGQSEWYLDGKRLVAPGSLASDSDSSVNGRLTRFVPLALADTNVHLLAVRYQFRRESVLNASYEQEAFAAQLSRADDAPFVLLSMESVKTGMAFLMMGIFGVLALLHFLFYKANRTQRVNKLLGWEMLAFAVGFGLRRLSKYIESLTAGSLSDLIGSAAMHSGSVLLLTALYQYLNLRRDWFYYTVVGLVLAAMVYGFGMGDVPYGLDAISYLLMGFAYLRVSWIGRKRNDDYSRLPWVSLRLSLYCLVALFAVAIVVGIVQATSRPAGSDININFDTYSSGLVFLIVVLGLLSFPVGLSLSLAQDYGRTYLSLVNKLAEVEQLSARNLAQEQEKQTLLAQQNETLEQLVEERTADLRATQDQLIQREKLASLGELTAGVAHEIQNPLNFVNNFSEVSVDLLAELEDERARPADQRDEGLEEELMADLKQNMGKISEHGKRAASIVRGMLQHSRVSTGQRKPTDLNALADEYLKLAYHGIRATDKSFEVSLVTHFDPALPPVPVVSSDVGRVLMNLITNAFHAVRERAAGVKQQDIPYVPTVTLTTEYAPDVVRIRIHDNGTGIPEAVRSKIFQPFFTTKPTGQGTGLGLSISYDIVTKGHGGALIVQSEPGAFTEFVIELPV